MDNKIKEILKYAVMAPSGDNSQPWRFEVEGNKIFIYNIPEKDTSLYNFSMGASIIAIGALIENIKISATHYDYDCEVVLEKDQNSDLVAFCILSENTNPIKDDLFEFIDKRKTNRKPYKRDRLSFSFLEELNKLKLNVLNNSSVSFEIQDDVNSINNIAKASSMNEKIVLENKKLHDFLFNHITWTEEEDKEKKGFFIDTLELKGPEKFVFKVLKSWKILNLLNNIGISKMISKENAKIYSQSGAMLAITASELDKLSFIKTGMLMQRLWLTATKHGIYMHPLTGIVFLNNRINKESNTQEFNRNHIDIIKDSFDIIRKEMSVNDSFITMLFRVGYADIPTSFTRRHAPSIKFKVL